MIPDWLSPPVLWIQSLQQSLVNQVASGQLMSGMPHGQEGWVLVHLLAFLVAPDVFLVLYSLAAPEYIPLFIGVTVICSILGGLLDYSLGFAGGKPLMRHPKYGKILPVRLQDKFQSFFTQYGLWTLVLCSFVPVPYKPLMLTTGAIRYPFPSMLLGLSLGRALRFLVMGGLLILFQEAFAQYFQWIVLGIALVVLLIVGIRQGVRKFEASNMKAEKMILPGSRYFFGASVTPSIGFKVAPPPHTQASKSPSGVCNPALSFEPFSGSSSFESFPLGARKP